MPKCDPVGLEFIEQAGTVVTVNTSVKASPAEVWKVLNDTERWPDWFDGMKECRVTSDAWDGVGSTRFVHIGLLRADEEMVTWESEVQWGFCATQLNTLGFIAKRMLEVVDIEPAGTGSKLTYTGAFDLVPWLRPVGGLLKKQLGKAWATSFSNIDNQIS